MENVAVVIPAAGSGARMGGVPKQLRMLGDAPVLVQTLRAFAHAGITRRVVAAAPGEVGVTDALLQSYGVEAAVVAGGATRQASVGHALDAVEEAGLVLVHDAVRPFIALDRIAAVVEAAREVGAAALAVPVADTLRRADGAPLDFGETVDRAGLWRMQTPQAARLSTLRASHAAASADGFVGTDEVEVMQRAGHRVRLVEGDARNLKLTHPPDWSLAEALWPRWRETHAGPE